MTQPAQKNQAVPHRIIDITLESASLVTRSSDIEIERHKAISDLLDENTFTLKAAPAGTEGPYRLQLGIEEGRLVMQIACTRSGFKDDLRLSLAALKQHIADYIILCDNFYKTARAGQIYKLEAIDAGRRSIHDEAAEILSEALENKVIMDKATARRLFSLLYVLHMRTTPTII